jgi:hypothetical protein
MRTLLKSLIVVIAMVGLPSCTAYMHEGHARDGYHRCARESLVGVIGIAIARGGESRRGPLVVAHVLPGSPAADANLRPGDRIRAIDGESTRGMTIPEAARLIRGPVDAAVELRLESPRGARLITLVRVPAHAVWHGGGCHHGHDRPCTECRHGCTRCRERSEGVPALAAPPPPDVDESLAPQLWPPTKPGHSVP